MSELCDSLGFLTELIFPSEETLAPPPTSRQSDFKWLLFYISGDLLSPIELASPSHLDTSSKQFSPFQFDASNSSFSVIFPSKEQNFPSPTTLIELFNLKSIADENCKQFLLFWRQVQKDADLFVVDAHLVYLTSTQLKCIAEFQLEDCLDQYLDVAWKIQRRMFYYGGVDNAISSFSIQLCISNELKFNDVFSSPYLGLPYVSTVLAFSFPTSHWLSFWPWDYSISMARDSFSFSQLILSTHNRADLLSFASVFWFYIVPFVVGRLMDLERYCDLNSLLLAFDSFELANTSNHDTNELNSMTGGQPLRYFLTGLEDLSAFSDPVVLEIMRTKVLPYASVDDFDILASSVPSDFLVRVLQDFSMCHLIADYKPEFIISLLENAPLLSENFQSLFLIANHEGDFLITSWLRFILNIYLDIITQIDTSELDSFTLMKRTSNTFLVFEPLHRTINMELQRLERALRVARCDLRILTRLALRRALRTRLSRLTPCFVSLSSYIRQLPIPDRDKKYISIPGII